MEENEDWQAQADPQEPHGDGTDWKAECRKWETRAKQNRVDADELKQAREDLAAAQAALEAEKQSRKLEAARAKIAEETGVPAEFVVGGTEAQMRSFAEKLSEHYKAPAAPAIGHAGVSVNIISTIGAAVEKLDRFSMLLVPDSCDIASD